MTTSVKSVALSPRQGARRARIIPGQLCRWPRDGPRRSRSRASPRCGRTWVRKSAARESGCSPPTLCVSKIVIRLSPEIAAISMSGSSVIVAVNALLLLIWGRNAGAP